MENIVYWDDFGHRTEENIKNLNIANVTIATRFKIDEKFGGLKIGKASKQYLLGFFNPVPEFISERPSLVIVVKKYDKDLQGNFMLSFKT